jgi:predicted site-specific integrase-resolvase
MDHYESREDTLLMAGENLVESKCAKMDLVLVVVDDDDDDDDMDY